jgi:hypothetical protein
VRVVHAYHYFTIDAKLIEQVGKHGIFIQLYLSLPVCIGWQLFSQD